jgi:hypothetical protein
MNLSKLAWRRNGLFGRLTYVRNNLEQIIKHERNFLNPEETKQLVEAKWILDKVLSHQKPNWEKRRKHYEDTNRSSKV